MKYQSTTKRERNCAVCQLHKEHPELSLREIAKEFGVSVSCIFNILRRNEKGKAWQKYDNYPGAI